MMACRQDAVDRVMHELGAVRRDHVVLDRLITAIEHESLDWAIVGGAPRRWILGGSEDPRDIDLAVAAPHDTLERLVEALCLGKEDEWTLGRTSLGGMRVSNGLDIDLWAVESTPGIGKAKGEVSSPFHRLAMAIPLSLDSVVVTSCGECFERGFFRTLRTGVLELKSLDIVGPDKMLKKIATLCEAYSLRPDATARRFVDGERMRSSAEDPN